MFNNFKFIKGVKIQVMANLLFDYIKIFYTVMFSHMPFPLGTNRLWNRVGTEVTARISC